MFAFLSDFFEKKRLNLFAPVPLEACDVQKPYLLERAGIASGTVVMIAVPYFTKAALAADRNLSAYAVPRDYHGYFKALFDELLPRLRAAFPEERFEGFADHSPIDERSAAALAGLGVIGKNRMLLTEPYSSYVFLGELITTARIPCHAQPIRTCSGCGACLAACPAQKNGGCLSALTQKKGVLNEEEQAVLLAYGSAWGCDICQQVCPFTLRALKAGTIFSPIPYFSDSTVPHLTTETLDRMTDAEFAQRAYAWHGRETVRRNLALLENPPESEQV